jgi:twitching motility protein PilT
MALRSSMSFNLKAIIAQKLIKTIRDDPKRVPIVEIMTVTPTVRKLILEEKDDKLADAIRIAKAEGMQQFNDSLYYFVTEEFISRADAFEISPNTEQLKMMLKGIEVKASAIL